LLPASRGRPCAQLGGEHITRNRSRRAASAVSVAHSSTISS
jgi:hypothetical protein